MAPENKAWVLKSGFTTTPKQEYFDVKTIPYPVLEDGQYLLKMTSISVDPYLYAYFRNVDTKDMTVQTYGVGQIIESKNDNFPVGLKLTGVLPAQLYVATNDTKLRVVDEKYSDSLHVGILGMPGATAYGMVTENVKQGDIVVCTASAGVVGSAAAILAKRHGARFVIGFAGSDQKCALAVEKFGYDICINYHKFDDIADTDEEKAHALQNELKDILHKHKFNGIDVYFDLVGGFITQSMWNLLNPNASAIIVGQIDEYNDEKTRMIPSFLSRLIYKAIRVQGYIVSQSMAKPNFWENMDAEIKPLIDNNGLDVKETVLVGFERLPEAFVGLFTGANIGKMVVNIE